MKRFNGISSKKTKTEHQVGVAMVLMVSDLPLFNTLT
jgi:hypothetical protein